MARTGLQTRVSAMSSIIRMSASPLASRTPSTKNLLQTSLRNRESLAGFASGDYYSLRADGCDGWAKHWFLSQQLLRLMMRTTNLEDARSAEQIAFEAPAKIYVKLACVATWITSTKLALSPQRAPTIRRQPLLLQRTLLSHLRSKSQAKACQVC